MRRYIGQVGLLVAGLLCCLRGAGAQTQVAEPSFSPPPGEYAGTQSVTISTTTPGAIIYYTVDGSTPTTASAMYTSPVTVASPTTLKAIAAAPNLSNSSTGGGAYMIAANAVGFGGGFSAGSMVFNGNASLNGTRLRLTNGGASEASSAWYPTPLNVQSFTTDFQFQITSGTTPTADGFTFTIQGNGISILGPSGGGLGYGPDTPGGTPGISNSVAVKFDLYGNAGEGINSTGMYINGASPTVPARTLGGGVNLHSGDIFQVHLSYDGSTLAMTITDTVNSTQTFTTTWPIDILATLGQSTAYVGFTGGTGGLTAIQDILTWTYAGLSGSSGAAATPTFSPPPGTYVGTQNVSISDGTPGAAIFYTLDGSTPATSVGGSTQQYTSPITVSSSETIQALATASGYAASTPASATYTISATGNGDSIDFGAGFVAGAMTLNGQSILNGTRLRLTNGGASEASSAWYPTPLNVQSFTTDFQFQITSGTTPTADGFTFTIQGNGISILGPSGGGLGYGPDTPGGTPGISNSVAVKFDLYGNAGEGINSTGMYIDGASPTVPARTLGGGVNLHSGDIFQVHLSYDGSTLTMTITDTVNSTQTFTTAWPINIPETVGGNQAYIGFTGGTGGLTAVQDIVSWTYAASPAQVAPTITTQPTNQTVIAGQTATFTVVATGIAPLSYQWQKNGVNISGATSVSYSTPATTASDNGSTFDVLVSNAGGALTSSLATLTVNPALVPEIQLSSTAVKFGNVVVGTNSSQALIIKNTGTAPLNIYQVSATGSGFSIAGLTVTSSVGAGQQTTITAAFLPTVIGSASGNISIVSDASTSPTFVSLSGAGIAASLSLGISPTALNFGNVPMGTSSATQNIAISNTGNSSVTISQITLRGAGYTMSGGNVPVTLSPSQTVLLSVQFSPVVAGSASGSITIESDASGSPASASLSGAGVTSIQHSVDLSWSPSPSTVVGYNLYRSTVDGGPYTKINSAVIAAMTYTDATVQGSTTYYYVGTAVDASGNESIYSNQVEAVIP